MQLVRIISVVLLGATSYLANAHSLPRSVMHGSKATMDALKKLTMNDKPFLLGPSPARSQEDVDHLESLGAVLLGKFTVVSKKEIMFPKGQKLPHLIFNLPPGSQVREAEKYMMVRKLQFIYDLRIPKSEETTLTYGPEDVKDLPADEHKVKLRKPEDNLITHADNDGPTAAYYTDVQAPDVGVEIKTITSSYAPVDWLKDNADLVMEHVDAWEKEGWFLLSSTRERIMLYSPSPKTSNATWLGSLKSLITSMWSGSVMSWESTAEKVFREVKTIFPHKEERVPHELVHYEMIGTHI